MATLQKSLCPAVQDMFLEYLIKAYLQTVQKLEILQVSHYYVQKQRVNNRYFLKFDGNKRVTSYINLNPKPSKPDIWNIFIVYRLKAFDDNNFITVSMYLVFTTNWGH